VRGNETNRPATFTARPRAAMWRWRRGPARQSDPAVGESRRCRGLLELSNPSSGRVLDRWFPREIPRRHIRARSAGSASSSKSRELLLSRSCAVSAFARDHLHATSGGC